MKKILLSKKHNRADELKISALGVFKIIKAKCAVCDALVMISPESKKVLDSDPEMLVNCFECAPKTQVTYAATLGQLKEMTVMRIKSQAQKN